MPAADGCGYGLRRRGKTRKLLRHQLRRSGDLNLVREIPLNKREDVMCFKRTVGIAIGVVAMLTMAAPVLSQETSGKDEAFQLTTVFGVNNTGIGNLSNTSNKTFFSFDISWVDDVLHIYYLADRSNKTIDILDLSTF